MDLQSGNHLTQASLWLGMTWVGDHVFQLIGSIGVIVTIYVSMRRHRRNEQESKLRIEKLKLEIAEKKGGEL